MNKKTARALLLSAVFVIFTVLVKRVDVRMIGPEESSVGFGTLNGVIANWLGFRYSWYMISEIAGYVALLVIGLYGLMGFLQLIKRKNLFKVDKDILVLGVFYVVVGIFYVLFNKVVVNYRPVILEEALEASYPSSHTMLAVSAFLSAVRMELKGSKGKTGLFVYCLWVLAAVLVISRFMSGVHWATDILGGLLLSGALLTWFDAALDKFAPEA